MNRSRSDNPQDAGRFLSALRVIRCGAKRLVVGIDIEPVVIGAAHDGGAGGNRTLRVDQTHAVDQIGSERTAPTLQMLLEAPRSVSA